MYSVFIDYKDGSHKSDTKPTSEEANALVEQWKAEAPWHDAGFCLISNEK